MSPFSSLAMTNRPPGTERSIDERRLSVVHVLVVLVAQAEVERQVVARRQSSCAYRCSQFVRPSSSPRPMPDTAEVG